MEQRTGINAAGFAKHIAAVIIYCINRNEKLLGNCLAAVAAVYCVLDWRHGILSVLTA